jgi:hypothetical protein
VSAHLLQLSLLDTQRVWQQGFTAWCDALHRKVKVVQVSGACRLRAGVRSAYGCCCSSYMVSAADAAHLPDMLQFAAV